MERLYRVWFKTKKEKWVYVVDAINPKQAIASTKTNWQLASDEQTHGFRARLVKDNNYISDEFVRIGNNA